MSEEAAAFLRARRLPLRMVIFDCDGVLIDSEALSNRVVAATLAAEGWVMTEAECEHRFIGLSYSATQIAAEAHLGRALGADWVPSLVDRTVAVMADSVEPMPGALAALESASALGLPWRIASNSSRREMEAKFGRTGWRELVEGRVHSAYDPGIMPKPAPDVFLAAAAAEGHDPGHCLVIEDSPAGAAGALAAGMACLGLAPRGDHPGLRDAGAVLFRSMHDLPAILRGMSC